MGSSDETEDVGREDKLESVKTDPSKLFFNMTSEGRVYRIILRKGRKRRTQSSIREGIGDLSLENGLVATENLFDQLRIVARWRRKKESSAGGGRDHGAFKNHRQSVSIRLRWGETGLVERGT